ncbi:MAG: nucleotidyltransferase domain-containing protein [Bacteroidetes bacterium]|jgi:predicted nucleotidyltransferase|nr:nucleotidyltransferase domain-containing protein [Bacteroidota bacterium]
MSARRALSEEQLDRLAAVFAAHPEVRAAYLFGSAAEGRLRPGSDVDIGIFTGDVPYPKLELLTDLARQGFDRVDLVRLDDAVPVVQFEAVRQNRLIYAVKDFDRGTTYSRVIRRYLDILPYLERHRRAYKRRLLGDTP